MEAAEEDINIELNQPIVAPQAVRRELVVGGRRAQRKVQRRGRVTAAVDNMTATSHNRDIPPSTGRNVVIIDLEKHSLISFSLYTRSLTIIRLILLQRSQKKNILVLRTR